MPSKTVRVSIVLPEIMWQTVLKLSKKRKMSASSFVREILEDQLGIPDTIVYGGKRERDMGGEDDQGQPVAVPAR